MSKKLPESIVMLNTAIDNIVKEFSKKYDVEVLVINNLCTYDVYQCADMYIDLATITYCIKDDIQFDTLYNWYWFNLHNMRILLSKYIAEKSNVLPDCDVNEYHIYLLTKELKSYTKQP